MTKFQGFDVSRQNWFRMPNEWTNITSKMTTIVELKLVEYVLRHTWGFNEYDKYKKITIDEFENGRKTKNGERIDEGTGLSKNSIINGLKKAVENGYIEETTEGDPGRVHKYYRLKIKTQEQQAEEGCKVRQQPEEEGCKLCTGLVQSLHQTSANFAHRSEKDTKKDTKKYGGALKKRPHTKTNNGSSLVQTNDWDKKAAGYLREVLVLHDADIVAPPRSVRVSTLAKHIAALRFRRKIPKEQVRNMVKWMKIHYSEPWCPKIHKAADVFDKWGKFRDAKLRQETDSGDVPENKHPRADLVARVREWLERERGLWCENYPTQEDTDEALQHFGEKPGTLKWNEIE